MVMNDEEERAGPRRIVRHIGEIVWAGAVGVWRSVSLLAGIGLVTLGTIIVGVGVALAAALNIAWLFAAAFALLVVVVVVGSYRVWSETDNRLRALQARPPTIIQGGPGGSGPGSGGGGGAAQGEGAIAYGGQGGRFAKPGPFEKLARASLGIGYPLDEFLHAAGFPSLDEVDRIGVGGHGGASLPTGPEAGQPGGPGLILIQWASDDGERMGVDVIHARGQFRIMKRDPPGTHRPDDTTVQE
jgi:hypothetical protein